MSPRRGDHRRGEPWVGAHEDEAVRCGVTEGVDLILRQVGLVGDPDSPVLEVMDRVLARDRLIVRGAVQPDRGVVPPTGGSCGYETVPST